MNGAAGQVRASGSRPGLAGSILALGRAVAFCGLMLSGVALLLAVVSPVVLAGLGFGRLIAAWLREVSFSLGLSIGGDDARRDLLAGLLGLALCFPLPHVLLRARSLAMLTRRLSALWCGVPIASAYQPRPDGGPVRLGYRQRMSWLLKDPATWRDLAWLVVNSVAGTVLLLVPVMLAGVGAVAFLVPAFGIKGDGTRYLVPPPAFPGNTRVVLLGIGLALVAAGAATAPVVLRAYAGLAAQVLAPSEQAALRLRVTQLDKTRRESLDTGAAELRRIERDLHDGAQVRLTALAMTLGEIKETVSGQAAPAGVLALASQAHQTAKDTLAELRDLARGIHPPALDRGLDPALHALTETSAMPVSLDIVIAARPSPAIEAIVYFSAAELLANTTKHAGASRVTITVHSTGQGGVRLTVADDGAGGALVTDGGGLVGLRERVGTVDGHMCIDSPAGGPTIVTIDLPGHA